MRKTSYFTKMNEEQRFTKKEDFSDKTENNTLYFLNPKMPVILYNTDVTPTMYNNSQIKIPVNDVNISQISIYRSYIHS